MKKIIIIVSGLILAYNTVYFRKLSEMKHRAENEFNFEALADSLYFKGILKSKDFVKLPVLLDHMKTSPDSAFKAYGNRLGIGNSAYFMVAAAGKVAEKSANSLKIITDENAVLLIDTKYIFGNTIRDASGLVKLTDFNTNAEFNKLSEALNTLIRERVMPEALKDINAGDQVTLTGATKFSKGQTRFSELNIIPVQLTKSSKPN